MAAQDFLEFEQLLRGDAGGLDLEVQPFRPAGQGGLQGGDLQGPQFGPLFFLDHRTLQPEWEAGFFKP